MIELFEGWGGRFGEEVGNFGLEVFLVVGVMGKRVDGYDEGVGGSVVVKNYEVYDVFDNFVVVLGYDVLFDYVLKSIWFFFSWLCFVFE